MQCEWWASGWEYIEWTVYTAACSSVTFMHFWYIVGAQQAECAHKHYKCPVPSLWHHQSTNTCLSGFGVSQLICLLISIHHRMMYSGALCVAELFVSMHSCVLPSVSFIEQQVGWVIKGCQWGIWPQQIFQLLFFYNTLYRFATLLDHRGIQAPLLIKITHSQSTERESKSRVAGENKEDMQTAFYVLFRTLCLSLCHRAIISPFFSCIWQMCLYAEHQHHLFWNTFVCL